MNEPKGLTLEVSVTDTELFNDVIKLLAFAHHRADKETQEVIDKRLAELIGKTHDVGRVLSAKEETD